ncbi:MAG: alpha/beta fold hydrolase [Geminicoccaceae bacterium]
MLALALLLVAATFAQKQAMGRSERDSQMSDDNNPYRLTTEEQLESAHRDRIESFWAENGREGEFAGEGAVLIAYMAFARGDESIAVVISSGRTESFIKYKELIYDLAQQDFAIYIVDHRGQGRSGRIATDPQMGHVVAFGDYVADLKRFVDSVVVPATHQRHVLVGHSMGGAIASLYLEGHPNDFQRAVLSSPMHEPGTGMIPADMACTALDVKKWIGNEESFAPGKGPYADAEVFTTKNCCTHSRTRYDLMRAAYDTEPRTKLGGPSVGWAVEACTAGQKARDDAHKIDVPVLLLQAGADLVVTAQGQRDFCTNLNAVQPDHCRLEVIDGGYHELFIESDDYRIPALTKIIDFIRAD